MFFKWAFPCLFFSLFSSLQQLTENAYVHYKTLPMTKLELETSINWATTSACQDNFCRYKMWSSSWLFSRLQVAKALTNPIHRENILWIARARGTTFSFEVSLENWSKLWEAICFFHFMLLLFFIWLFHRDRGYFRHRDPTFSFCLFCKLHLALTFHKMHRIYFYFDGPNLIHWLAARYTFLYTVVKSLPWSQ